jgi:hypothetical protein
LAAGDELLLADGEITERRMRRQEAGKPRSSSIACAARTMARLRIMP